jgi:dUTP pyrophosphatase
MFKLKMIHDGVKVPTKAYDGDAGFDVYSHSPITTLGFGERFKFKLGFALELPEGYVALIQGKSGLASDHGIFTIGNVIDSTYRGECHAILVCLNVASITIKPGQKVAQLLVLPCYTRTEYQIVDQLSDTTRGGGGFGSTGAI